MLVVVVVATGWRAGTRVARVAATWVHGDLSASLLSVVTVTFPGRRRARSVQL
jgi:hypothetical protein